jgi:hypothetical protein
MVGAGAAGAVAAASPVTVDGAGDVAVAALGVSAVLVPDFCPLAATAAKVPNATNTARARIAHLFRALAPRPITTLARRAVQPICES